MHACIKFPTVLYLTIFSVESSIEKKITAQYKNQKLEQYFTTSLYLIFFYCFFLNNNHQLNFYQ